MERLESKYEILEPMGDIEREAMYVAKEIGLEREVVIKIIRPNPDEGISKRGVKEYISHLKKLANLNISGLVSYLELLEPVEGDEAGYIVMEYIDGMNLKEYIKSDQVNNKDLLKVLMEVARSLSSLHKAKVCHSNIRPDNILISEGHVTLINPGLNNYEKAQSPAPALFANDKVDKVTEIHHLGACFISVILKQYHNIFADYSSPPGELDEKEMIEEMQRNFKLILVSGFAELLFDMVNSNPYKRPQSTNELAKRVKEILTKFDRNKLTSPLVTNRLIFLPKTIDIEDELEPTVVTESRKLAEKSKSKGVNSKKILKVEEVTERKEKYEDTISKRFSLRKRRRTGHHGEEEYLEEIPYKNSIITAGVVIVILLVFIVSQGGIREMFKAEPEQIVDNDITSELTNPELKVMVFAVEGNEEFNREKIYERIKKLDALVAKNRARPQFNTYMNKKVELLEIASISNSEYLIHRVLDDIENEIESI